MPTSLAAYISPIYTSFMVKFLFAIKLKNYSFMMEGNLRLCGAQHNSSQLLREDPEQMLGDFSNLKDISCLF